jgi:CRISPR/Cas system CSM-associated protein Csm5 (group 7 of RAMP superfamily)
MLLEKQEYFKMLDNYKKTFVGNVEYLRNSVQVLLDFNNFFKYYSNKNNFYLKIVTEARKKTDWLMKAKKNIQTITKNL